MKMSRDAVLQTRITRAQCFQMDILLKYNSERKIVLDPPTSQWVTE